MNMKIILNMAKGKLTKFLESRDGSWSTSIQDLNGWLKDGNFPFRIIIIDNKITIYQKK